jgi:hypothetical protein
LCWRILPCCRDLRRHAACVVWWPKLGSDPTVWTVYDGGLFIFGDILGQTAWGVDPAWSVA